MKKIIIILCSFKKRVAFVSWLALVLLFNPVSAQHGEHIYRTLSLISLQKNISKIDHLEALENKIRTERMRIENERTLSIEPVAQLIKDGDNSINVHTSGSINDYLFRVSMGYSEESKSKGEVEVGFPVSSNRNQTISRYREIEQLKRSQSKLQLQVLMLSDFKQIVRSVSQLVYLDQELDIFMLLEKEYTRLITLAEILSRNGTIPPGILNYLHTSQMSHTLTTEQLIKKRNIIKTELRSIHFIDTTTQRQLVNNYPHIMKDLKKRVKVYNDTAVGSCDQNVYSKMNRIESALERKWTRLSLNEKYSLTPYAKIMTDNDFSNYGGGVGLRFHLKNPKIVPDIPLFKRDTIECNSVAAIELPNDMPTDRGDLLVAGFKVLIDNKMGEIRLGNSGSFYQVSELLYRRESLLLQVLGSHQSLVQSFFSLINKIEYLPEPYIDLAWLDSK